MRTLTTQKFVVLSWAPSRRYGSRAEGEARGGFCAEGGDACRRSHSAPCCWARCHRHSPGKISCRCLMSLSSVCTLLPSPSPMRSLSSLSCALVNFLGATSFTPGAGTKLEELELVTAAAAAADADEPLLLDAMAAAAVSSVAAVLWLTAQCGDCLGRGPENTERAACTQHRPAYVTAHLRQVSHKFKLDTHANPAGSAFLTAEKRRELFQDSHEDLCELQALLIVHHLNLYGSLQWLTPRSLAWSPGSPTCTPPLRACRTELRVWSCSLTPSLA